MLKTLDILFRMENTYNLNTVIYALRKIPGVRKILREDWYSRTGLKTVVYILTMLWMILKFLAGKIVYAAFLLLLAGKLFGNGPMDRNLLQLLLVFSIIGAFMNNSITDGSVSGYYAIVLMRMNARKASLARYGMNLAGIFAGMLLICLLMGKIAGIPVLMCIIVPCGIVGMKLLYSAGSLLYFRKTGRRLKKRFMIRMILTGTLVMAAYISLFLQIFLPQEVIGGLFAGAAVSGLFSGAVLAKFPFYGRLQKQILSEVVNARENMRTAVRQSNDSKISSDVSIISHRNGLEYLNELFVKRHKKILWGPAHIMSGIILAVFSVFGILLFWPGTAQQGREIFRELLTGHMTIFFIPMYMMNRGTGFSSALFYNCDHSLLTFRIFRNKEVLLKLFRIRLRDLIRINLLPAGVTAAACIVLARLCFGNDILPAAFLSGAVILAMSIFFSIHYLMLYYIFQPFTAGSNKVNGVYSLIIGMTYWPAYWMSRIEADTRVLGPVILLFAMGYFLAALVLVYRLAPKKFRVRS